MKRGKRSQPPLPPTQPPEQVEATPTPTNSPQVLAPSLVVDNEEEVKTQQRARGRKLGAEKKHLDAQFAAEARAMIDKHPHVKASTLATWLQDKSETKSLPGVTRPDGKPMEHRSLAKKIIRYRQEK